MSNKDRSDGPPRNKAGNRRGMSKGSAKGQIPKGVSGNPEGRSPGSKNRSTIIREVLSEKVGATIGGEVKKISVKEGAVRSLVVAALEGKNLKAIQTVLALWEESEARIETADENAYRFDDRDREVINELYERMKACDDEGFLG